MIAVRTTPHLAVLCRATPCQAAPARLSRAAPVPQCTTERMDMASMHSVPLPCTRCDACTRLRAAQGESPAVQAPPRRAAQSASACPTSPRASPTSGHAACSSRTSRSISTACTASRCRGRGATGPRRRRATAPSGSGAVPRKVHTLTRYAAPRRATSCLATQPEGHTALRPEEVHARVRACQGLTQARRGHGMGER
jgi:hypothetical protein